MDSKIHFFFEKKKDLGEEMTQIFKGERLFSTLWYSILQQNWPDPPRPRDWDPEWRSVASWCTSEVHLLDEFEADRLCLPYLYGVQNAVTNVSIAPGRKGLYETWNRFCKHEMRNM